jgi:hypothetical protein
LNRIAIEFVQHVLRENPTAHEFVAIYDAMWRAACGRSFHRLGYTELAQVGISFSLLNTGKLEQLITEAQSKMPSEYQAVSSHESSKETVCVGAIPPWKQ